MQPNERTAAPRGRFDRLIALGLRCFVAGASVIAIAGYVGVYGLRLANAPIRSDGYSYYVYLPSFVLHHDPTLAAVADDCCGGTFPAFTAIVRWPTTGNWVNAHPIGVAVQMLPFFVVAHLLTRWSNLPPDGFSLYYQHGAGLAGLVYFLAGLAIVRRTLSRHFSPGVTLGTLAAITWGTNLFHYGVYDSTFSHAFSFFLIAALVSLTEAWWDEPAVLTSLALSVTGALVTLTRHTNIIFLLMVPLYNVTCWRDLRRNARSLVDRGMHVGMMLAVAAVCIAPQLAIYKRATGKWIVSSYGPLGFTFLSPHLFGVLFSVQKGLFFWSPVLLLTVPGLWAGRGLARRFALAAAVVMALHAYLIASWWDWQFGGSYGHRGFTDSLGLLAIFLAAFFAWTAERPRLVPPVGAVVLLAVMLSVAQMIQYWMGILPFANTTWDQYHGLFLHFR
jgi:hypothetical protein